MKQIKVNNYTKENYKVEDKFDNIYNIFFRKLNQVKPRILNQIADLTLYPVRINVDTVRTKIVGGIKNEY